MQGAHWCHPPLVVLSKKWVETRHASDVDVILDDHDISDVELGVEAT